VFAFGANAASPGVVGRGGTAPPEIAVSASGAIAPPQELPRSIPPGQRPIPPGQQQALRR
jgi:hypothetical protein